MSHDKYVFDGRNNYRSSHFDINYKFQIFKRNLENRLAEKLTGVRKRAVRLLLSQIQAAIYFDAGGEEHGVTAQRSSSTILNRSRMKSVLVKRDTLPPRKNTSRISFMLHDGKPEGLPAIAPRAISPDLSTSVPYFDIAAKQRAVLTRTLRARASLDHVTKTSTKTTNIVSLRMCGNMQHLARLACRKYVFAFWRYAHRERKKHHRRLSRFFPSAAFSKQVVFNQWRLVSAAKPLLDLTTQVADSEFAIASLRNEISHLTKFSVANGETALLDRRGKADDLSANLQLLKEQHGKLRAKSANADVISRRKVLFAKLRSVADDICDCAGLAHEDLRKDFLLQNLDGLSTLDNEGPAIVCMLPVDELLARWLNHLLMLAKIRASQLLDAAEASSNPDNINGAGSSTTCWGAKDSAVFKERLKMVRNLPSVQDLTQDLRGGGALVASA